MRNDFVFHDDNLYVTQNPLVQDGLTAGGLKWAFTEAGPTYWHPLTWVSHMAVCQVFGLDARAHHLVNVILHAASTVLLLLALSRMTGAPWRSAFVAAVFAVHPLHVESVAWVAERKDVLSAFFWMLTILVYARYARTGRWRWYGLALAAFVGGLMSKPMVVTLPVVLLLLDYWPLRRLRLERGGLGPLPRLLLEKVPFLVLAAAASVVTVVMMRGAGELASLDDLPLANRVANAVINYAQYVGKTLWPSNLAVYYDEPADPGLWLLGGLAMLVGVSILAIRGARTRPHLLVGWLWYLGTLVPVIGLVQVWILGIADRFTYLPMIGLLIMVAWSVPDAWAARRPGRWAVGAAAIAVVAACAVLTSVQVRYWRDTLTLFEHALDIAPDNPLALNNVAWIDAAHPDPAFRHEARAVRLAERLADLTGHENANYMDTLGVAYAAAGRWQDARAAAQRAIDLAMEAGGQEAAVQFRGRLRLYEQEVPFREHNRLITGAARP